MYTRLYKLLVHTQIYDRDFLRDDCARNMSEEVNNVSWLNMCWNFAFACIPSLSTRLITWFEPTIHWKAQYLVKLAHVDQVRFSVRFVAAIMQGFPTCLKLVATLAQQKLHRVATTKIYTCQLFLRYKREIFILGVLGFLKTIRSFLKNFPKKSEVFRRRPKSFELLGCV